MATLRGALEESSSKRCGEGLGLVYNPAFIALGSVVHDLLHPDMILVGESDPRSGAAVEAFHLTLCKSVPTIHRTGFANAELAKIGLNAFVTMKISFANAVARLCESVPGADVDVVCSAIGSDRRIGHRYLKGATAYGGPCFPRDNRALARVARVRGLSMRLAEATDRINGEQGRLLARRVRELLAGRRRVALLGVAYKPETDVVDDSPALDLAEALLASGCRLTLWDPAALGAARRILGARVSYRRSLRAAVRGADVTVIVTPWNEIKRLRATDFGVRGSSRKVIVDCWRVLDARTFAARVKYVPLGVGTVGER
jgi:UDPglucose 6-dehydrogenase